MKHITFIKKTGYGHWLVNVEEVNHSRDNEYRVTSITRWEYTTTDSMAIGDYHSYDEKAAKKGEKALIRQTVTWGKKEIIKF